MLTIMPTRQIVVIHVNSKRTTTKPSAKPTSASTVSPCRWPMRLTGRRFGAPDDRKDYGELPEIGSAVVANRLYCIVFTQRGETFRMISLRKANTREIQRDEKATGIEP